MFKVDTSILSIKLKRVDIRQPGKGGYMLALSLILADGVTIKIGDNVWSFGLNFIVYLIIAAIIGLLAEFIVGWRLPLGFVGAIIAALIGIWLMTNVIIITGLPDIKINTSPPVYLVRALIGAIIFVAIWHLITYPLYRSRRRNYYRRA
jgi:uncharacterized membrane protein YeaQ/YmgE (transglycosylase-associated protein family)